jgi:hypothetical protein
LSDALADELNASNDLRQRPIVQIRIQRERYVHELSFSDHRACTAWVNNRRFGGWARIGPQRRDLRIDRIQPLARDRILRVALSRLEIRNA